jgi:hypothetical protein
MRSVLNSSNCCGARRRTSVFAFGVTALYVRKERCQYKCRNVLAFLDNRRFAAVAHFQTLQISLRGPGFQKSFQKIGLTTIFANVKPPSIRDRIVSVRLWGGSLGGQHSADDISFVFSSFFRVGLVRYAFWAVCAGESDPSRTAIIHGRSGSRAMRILHYRPRIRTLRFLNCFQASDGWLSGFESNPIESRETALRI